MKTKERQDCHPDVLQSQFNSLTGTEVTTPKVKTMNDTLNSSRETLAQVALPQLDVGSATDSPQQGAGTIPFILALTLLLKAIAEIVKAARMN